MNEQKNNNGRGIFYGVIGVATLVVAIIGATFAYFTATQNAGNNVITGNMAMRVLKSQLDSTIKMYLQDVKDSLGRKVLFRGLYPGE